MPHIGRIATATVLALTLAWGLPRSVAAMRQLHAQNAQVAQVATLVESQVPHGSIVMAKSPAINFLDFLGKWRLTNLPFGTRPGPGGPPFPGGGMVARLSPGDKDHPARRPESAGATGDLADLLARMGAWPLDTLGIFAVGDETMIGEMENHIPSADRLVILAKIERSSLGIPDQAQLLGGIPAPGPMPMPGGMGPRFPPMQGTIPPGGGPPPIGRPFKQGALVLTEWVRG